MALEKTRESGDFKLQGTPQRTFPPCGNVLETGFMSINILHSDSAAQMLKTSSPTCCFNLELRSQFFTSFSYFAVTASSGRILGKARCKCVKYAVLVDTNCQPGITIYSDCQTPALPRGTAGTVSTYLYGCGPIPPHTALRSTGIPTGENTMMVSFNFKDAIVAGGQFTIYVDR
jgi:hypothetical protein